jgi:hypothetical protein
MNPSRKQRQGYLNDLPEGTSTIQTLAMDPDIDAAIAGGASRGQVAKLIQSKYGAEGQRHFVPATYEAMKRGQPVTGDRYKALADMLINTPAESRAKGIFGNHPAFDYETKVLRDSDSLAAGNTVLKALAEHAKPMAAQAPGTVSVRDVLKKVKLASGLEGVPKKAAPLVSAADGDGAIFEMARLRGQPKASHAMLDERIPASLAEDLGRFYEGFKSPEPVKTIWKAVDGATNLFKASVLTWPARYVRDLMSGQFQNFTAGIFSPQSVSGRRPSCAAARSKALLRTPRSGNC